MKPSRITADYLRRHPELWELHVPDTPESRRAWLEGIREREEAEVQGVGLRRIRQPVDPLSRVRDAP